MQENINLQPFNGAEDKINETNIQFIPARMEVTTSVRAPVKAYFDQYTEGVDGGKQYNIFV